MKRYEKDVESRFSVGFLLFKKIQILSSLYMYALKIYVTRLRECF